MEMCLLELGLRDTEWTDTAQDRDKWAGFCECHNEPPGSKKKDGAFLDYLRQCKFVRRNEFHRVSLVSCCAQSRKRQANEQQRYVFKMYERFGHDLKSLLF
jgi:hypothetical protein